MWRCVACVLISVTSLSGSAWAESGTETWDRWTVQAHSGDVSVAGASALGWRPIESGQILSAPFTVRTGSTGHATLARGEDHLLVAPHSEILVRATRPSDTGLLTRILQSIGDIVYQVEKRSRQRFEVETPYLVSVVKGTTFTISVTESDTAVSLTAGALEVSSTDGAHRALLQPGEIARRTEGVRGIQISNALLQHSRWGAWHPANRRHGAGESRRSSTDASGRQAPSAVIVKHGVTDTASGTGRGTPGPAGSAPGRSYGPPGLTGPAPGLWGGPPGLTGSAPGLLGGIPGLGGGAPGHPGRGRGLDGSAPGLNK